MNKKSASYPQALRNAYERTNGICVICGKKLSPDENTWSPDHFIPRAVYKWIPNQETKKAIESEENIFIVHPKCNLRKNSTLPSNRVISYMHASQSVKNSVKSICKQTEDSVSEYRKLKQNTLNNQNGRCASCGKKLCLDTSTLRRINNRKDRVESNAMCLCDKCNVLAGTSAGKKRITSKIKKK